MVVVDAMDGRELNTCDDYILSHNAPHPQKQTTLSTITLVTVLWLHSGQPSDLVNYIVPGKGQPMGMVCCEQEIKQLVVSVCSKEFLHGPHGAFFGPASGD